MIGLGCIAWSVGNCALPLFGWAIARWKWIKVVCTVPAMIMYLTYFITPESPRWLVSQGRMEDAKEVLTKIAKTNGSKVPEDIEVKISYSSVPNRRVGRNKRADQNKAVQGGIFSQN